jgi:IS5 family transposase
LSAARLGIERGQRVRIDSTVVEAWVHAPTDSLLLFDGVRVFLRLLRRAEHLAGFAAYHRHLKRAKRRLMEIQHSPPQATHARKRAYRDLIILAETIGYAACALEELSGQLRIPSQSDAHQRQLKLLLKLHRQLAHYIPLVERVIQQTTQRVLEGESDARPLRPSRSASRTSPILLFIHRRSLESLGLQRREWESGRSQRRERRQVSHDVAPTSRGRNHT